MKKVLIGVFVLATSLASAQIPSADLKVWLKADDITLPDNSQVTSWSDAMGGGDFQISGSVPIFKKNGCPGYLNGQPYVTFDTGLGFGQFYRNDIAGLTRNGARTMIAVYRLFNTTSRSFVLDVNEAGSNFVSYGFDANTWQTAGNKFGFYALNNSYDTNTPTDNFFHIQYVTGNSLTIGANVIADTEFRIDNNVQTLDFRSGSGNYIDESTANQIYFGGYVEISEFMIYNRVLTATERNDVSTYLKNKYGTFPIAPIVPIIPTISSFAPESAPAGSQVTITGTNFTGATDVTFNGLAATSFTVNSATSITATVPSGVTPGPISVTASCNTGKSVSYFWPPYTPLGNTLTCNGSADYVTIPDNPLLRPASLTLSTWVKFTSLSAFVPLMTKQLGTAVNNSFALWYESGTLRGTIEDAAGSNPLVIYNWTPVLNEWYHVAFTFDDATKTQTLYLNGANVGTVINAVSPEYDNSPVYLAADLNSGVITESAVVLDESRIWEAAISQSQLLSTMYSALTGSETALIGYYKMDEVGQGEDLVVKNSAAIGGAAINGITVGTCTTPIFTLMSPPVITGFTPAAGSIGSIVTIAGTDFSAAPSKNIVMFNGIAATVTASTPTTITTTVPAGATDGKITVTICGNMATSVADFRICIAPSDPVATGGTRCGAGSVVLNATGGSDGHYRWYTTANSVTAIAGETHNIYSTPSISVTTTYYVSIVNNDCESARVSVVAEVKSCEPTSGELVIYNALSKSRDGKNDIFYIESIDVLPDAKENKVTIINRWGDVVFEVEDYDNKTRVFTGVNKSGAELPSGVYYYKIEFKSGRKRMDGWIEVR